MFESLNLKYEPIIYDGSVFEKRNWRFQDKNMIIWISWNSKNHCQFRMNVHTMNPRRYRTGQFTLKDYSEEAAKKGLEKKLKQLLQRIERGLVGEI